MSSRVRQVRQVGVLEKMNRTQLPFAEVVCARGTRESVLEELIDSQNRLDLVTHGIRKIIPRNDAENPSTLTQPSTRRKPTSETCRQTTGRPTAPVPRALTNGDRRHDRAAAGNAARPCHTRRRWCRSELPASPPNTRQASPPGPPGVTVFRFRSRGPSVRVRATGPGVRRTCRASPA